MDVFRTQLWLNHLMTPEVLARGKKASEVETECQACGASGVATAWHLLGECKLPALVTSRRAAGKLTREKIVERARGAYIVQQGGYWRRPPGVGGHAVGAKAGEAANGVYAAGLV